MPALPARHLHELLAGDHNMYRIDLRRLGLGILVGLLVPWVAPVWAGPAAPLERNWMVPIHAITIEEKGRIYHQVGGRVQNPRIGDRHLFSCKEVPVPYLEANPQRHQELSPRIVITR